MKTFTTLFVAFFILVSQSAFVYAQGQNLVQNPDFEKISGTELNSWTTFSKETNTGLTEFKLDNSIKHSGNSSICIINKFPNSVGYVQRIHLEKHSTYKFSFWVKTENIGEDGVGANISINNRSNNTLKVFADIRRTNTTWKLIETNISSNNTADLILSLGLGSSSSYNFGKVWFDDIVIQKNNPDVIKFSKTAFVAYLVLFVVFLGILFHILFRRTAIHNNHRKYKNKKVHEAVSDMLLFRPSAPPAAAREGSRPRGSALLTPAKVPLDLAGTKSPAPLNSYSDISRKKELLYLCIFLLSGFILRLILAPIIEGINYDIYCWKHWSSAAATSGIVDVYTNTELSDINAEVNYPPVYIYALFIIGKIASYFSLYAKPSLYTLVLKLPAIIADLITSYMIFNFAKNKLSVSLRLFIIGSYIFNPAVILNSTIWGQVDSILTMFLIAGLVYICENKLTNSSAALTASILTKPQGIIMLPVIFLELIKKRSIRTLILCGACTIATLVLIVIPFALKFGPLWLPNLIIKTISGSDQASLNAFNLFALLGANFKYSSSILFIFSYHTWGFIFIALITCFVGLLYIKGTHSIVPIYSAAILYTGVFVLSSGMHERYLFPVIAIVLLAFISTGDKRLMYIFFSFTITVFSNMHSILFCDLLRTDPPAAGDSIVVVLSLANIILLLYLGKRCFDILLLTKHPSPDPFPQGKGRLGKGNGV